MKQPSIKAAKSIRVVLIALNPDEIIILLV